MLRISLLGCVLLLTLVVGITSSLALNKVLSLGEDGGYSEIVDSSILNSLDTQVTIEFWIRANEYKGDYTSIVYKGDEKEPNFSHRSFALWLHQNRYIYFTSAPDGSGQVEFHYPIRFNIWYHVAGVIDAINQDMKLFINGIEVSRRDYGDSIRTSIRPLRIGSSQEGHRNFPGLIDEIRIWQIVRTQEQIQDTMNRPLTLDEIQSETLVGYWNFDDGTANDLSQYGNHGTLYGDAYIANIIYVSTEGDDLTGDGTKDNPYRTIQQGIDESRRGDFVQALPGTYEENIELVSDLIVLGSSAEKTTITSDSGNIVMAHNVHNVRLSGFTIDGQGSADNGILCSGTTSEMEISNNVITDAITGIRCLDSVNVAIKNNTINQNISSGILCDGLVNVSINKNVIENNPDGIVCRSDAKVSIIENAIRRNTHNGIDSWNTVDLTIQDNTISENINAGAVFNDDSVVIVMLNAIQNNGHGLWCVENTAATISDNLIHHNKMSGISMSSSKTTIIRNIIHHNVWFDLGCYEGSGLVVIGGNLTNANNFVASSGIKIQNYTPYTINATYNYWGTTDESEIAAMIRNDGGGSIVFKPFINTLDEIIADTSGDGTISAYDAALILQYIVGLIDQFPATSPIGQAAQKYIAGDITIAELDRILQGFGYPSVFKMLGYENQLLQNYPNPFNPETWIPFKLAQNVPVSISIYDAKGQLIRTITLGSRTAGIYTTKDRAAYWDGRDTFGDKVASGVYYYTLQAGEYKATRKMVIVK